MQREANITWINADQESLPPEGQELERMVHMVEERMAQAHDQQRLEQERIGQAREAGREQRANLEAEDQHVALQVMERYDKQDFSSVVALEDEARAVATRAPPQAAWFIYDILGECYFKMGQYEKAIEMIIIRGACRMMENVMDST